MRISDWSSDVCSSDLVGKHLVIDELVPVGRLHPAVEHEHAADAGVLEQHDALVRRLTVEQNLVGLEAEPEVGVQRLLDPAAHRPLPRRYSSTTTCAGLKRWRSTSTARCGSAAPHMKMSSAA